MVASCTLAQQLTKALCVFLEAPRIRIRVRNQPLADREAMNSDSTPSQSAKMFAQAAWPPAFRSAPSAWSILIIDAWSDSGLSGRCLLAPMGGSPERYAARLFCSEAAQSEPVLVAVGISKACHEVLISVPGKKRRRRLAALTRRLAGLSAPRFKEGFQQGGGFVF